ncbi:MAG: D-alanine--D-alanine ligase [Candidatus Krumholzibacteriia bacterium]
MRVTVLMGGDSPEREVSLATGRAVADGLARAGHQVRCREIARVADVMIMTDLRDDDVVFPALHGGEGEDGHLQTVLELLGVTYALSGPLASALAMDKAATKLVMAGAGIRTPEWLLVTWARSVGGPVALGGAAGAAATVAPGESLRLDHVRDRALAELGLPLVIKLNGAGSSVGVEIVEHADQFAAAFDAVAAAAVGNQVGILLERYVPGRELTATVLMGRRLPLLEIRPHGGFYDYGHKYTRGASEYLVPAPVTSPHYEDMCADALQLYDLLGCRGVARVDFRYDGEHPWCLEINTIPGMTELSLVPMAAGAVGIGFDDLVDGLCHDALLRAGRAR